MSLNQGSRGGEVILDYLRRKALNPNQNEAKGDLTHTEEKAM